MIDNKKKIASFLNLSSVPHMMNWDDIKVGETYHIPPLIYNKRTDITVIEKTDNLIKVRKEEQNYTQTIFKTDITTRFIVEKQQIHGKT